MKTNIISLGIIAIVLVQILSGCGGGPRGPVTIAISPTSVTLDQGATQQFTASVTGARNTAVVWTVNGGSISPTGLYTAPARQGEVRVSATSAADPTSGATAVVTVREASLTVSPDGYSVLYQYRCSLTCGTFGPAFEMSPGATQQFTATVTGTVHQNVAWSVQEGAAGGSITSGGMYTAPATAGNFHIVASAGDGPQPLQIPVTVAALAVVISPRGAGLLPGQTHTFTATVAGSMDDRVSWVVQEGTTGGAITSEGLYTAPMEKGEYHIVSTSMAHPEISARAAVVVTNSGFTSAGEMTTARSHHTATLLPNGDVLLAGGGNGAEIWDHTTSAFRATGPMALARIWHTATLLPGGKVLVTGGCSFAQGGGWAWSCSVEDSAELYDPATGQFAPTGRMSAARYFHTATLLENGKVLIAGGLGSPPSTAELYDPATETFTPTGSLITGRSHHTATLLPDRRVLVAGGAPDATAEIYDPSSGDFAAAGTFAFSRTMDTATLLPDGRVLLAGGICDSANSPLCDDALIFDPSSGQFAVLAEKMSVRRSGHTATLLPSGYVLLAGGWLGPPATVGEASYTAELFNSSTSIFRLTGSMAQPRQGHTATLLLDGRVLIAGGTDFSGTEFGVKSAEFYTQ